MVVVGERGEVVAQQRAGVRWRRPHAVDEVTQAVGVVIRCVEREGDNVEVGRDPLGCSVWSGRFVAPLRLVMVRACVVMLWPECHEEFPADGGLALEQDA